MVFREILQYTCKGGQYPAIAPRPEILFPIHAFMLWVNIFGITII